MPFTITSTTIIFIILAIAILVLAYMVMELHKKLQKFLIGTNTENLGDSISAVNVSLEELQTFKHNMETYLLGVEERLQKGVQAVYTVRFNPFKGSTDSGGNQSFATAFLNQSGTGVVISTLYARERMSIFSKPIIKGISEYELSDEEKQAVAGALQMVKS